MDPDRKRKLLHGEGSSSSSGGAAPPPPPPPPPSPPPTGWREAVHSSVRVRNRALLAESLYLDPSEPITVDDALSTATSIEQGFYDDANSERDYLLMVSDNIQGGLRPEEIGEEPGTMPPQVDLNLSSDSEQQKGREPPPIDIFTDLLGRHRDTTGCLKNLMLLFNLRQPISVTSGQQLAVRLHKLRASVELVNALDGIKEQIEIVQEQTEKNLLSEPVEKYFFEKAYEHMIEGYLETFSRHIKNICDCPRGVIVDVDTKSASVDLTSQMRHLDNSEMVPMVGTREIIEITSSPDEEPPAPTPPAAEEGDFWGDLENLPEACYLPQEEPVKKPLEEVHSGSSSNSIVLPQHQLPPPPSPASQLQQEQGEQLGSNENQTDTLLDDLLAEFQAWLNIPNK